MKVMMPSTDTSTQPNPVSNVLVGTGELWGPYRDIQDLIERTVTDASPQNFAELEETLKLHKPDFINLLSTKPRSPADRDELKKGATEGIYLRGHDSKKVLQASIIHESIIMSDMFDINEFQALDLLTIAEIEQECHPGWGRGLLAVYMFYEGRAALVSSFVSLLQAIPGFTWSSRVPRKVVDLFQNFLNQVFQEDMIDRILGLLSKHKVKPQVEMLDSNLALGDWRHRVNVIGFIEKIREGLAQIIFCWSAQHGLAWKDALRILEYLKTNLILTDEFELEKEDVLLITSLLYAIDYSSSSATPPNRTFAVEMKKYCTENDFANGFQCVEILDLLKLTYFTNTYKLINETHITSVQNVPSYQLDPLLADINEDDDFEFRKDLFNFVRSFLFSKRDLFAEEEHIYRRFHLFFTDFITYLPLKVKDLKNRCEDAAKTVHLYNEQGLVQPPNLPQDYENFLECMSLFYAEDRFSLSSDYFSNEIPFAYLNKLVRSATVDYPFMFIHNVKMLTGLARGCPAGVFNMLKMNGHYLSLEHFFDSIIKYLASFGNQVNFNGPSLYTSDTYQRVVLDSMKMTVNPAEIQGICVYLDMIETLCNNSDAVKFYFTTTKSQWLKVAVTAGKVRSIPREIRAKMLNAASAMISKDQIGVETSMNLWEMFYSTRLIDYGSGDLRDELEDKEARLESYSLTIGLLKLINSLIEARFAVQESSPLEINLNSQIDNGVLQPYVSFVRDSVLLKVGYRSYKSIVERWELATLALGIVSKLLDYVPTLMLQMLSDSPLHRMCLGALVDCMRLKEMSVGWAPHVDKCSLQCLSLIQRVLQRQHAFLFRRELASGKQGTVVIGLHQLIMKVLPDSGKPDYLMAVVKFIDLMYPETHRHLALDILSMIISGHDETDSHVYAAIISEPTVAAILRQTLCELLDDPETSEDVKKLILKLMRSSIIHPSPNIALYLLGADKKVDFQNPGVQNYPRTLLHAVLDNATITPEAFVTLLMFIRDSRLASSLLRYLRTIQYFVKILMKEFPYPQMQFQCVGHFLKCVALELNNTKQPGPLAHILVGQERGKFQDILERIEMQVQSLEIPNLEFFDPAIVIQAMKTCEYHDRELNTKIVRLDVLESLLRDEISKLEKGTVLRLRKSVHTEAKELIGFARELNAARQREASKVLMFDGWKQCLEILLLNPAALKLAGVDFVTSILRLILDKVRSTVGPSEYFLRLAAETTLTLCAVMHKLHPEVKGSTLNVILNHLCAWVPEEQHALVRTYLYGAIHYVVDMIRDLDGTTTNQSSFSQIIDHLCRDVSQSSDFGRLQAMYLVGEIIRWTHSKSLGGHEITTVPSSTSATTIANVSRLGRTSYQSSFVEPSPTRQAAGLARISSPPTSRTYLFDTISNVGSPFSKPSPLATVGGSQQQKSFLEASSTPRRPVESRQVSFIHSPGPQTPSNGYGQRASPFSQGGKLSSTLRSVGESPPKSLNASGFHLSSVLSSGSRAPVRTETNENSSESSGDEDEEEPRRKSLMDCTSQDIFDTSNIKLARERDDSFGKVTTMRKLSLASGTPIKKSMEAMSSFSSSQSTLITHMHTKGYLRGLVDALPLVDDASLVQLFSNQPSSTHMRSLLIFEGKMSLCCRIAWAGIQPTLYLVDVNTILRLADMTVFDVNFGDEEADSMTITAMDQSLLTGFNDTMTAKIHIPSRINRMETLFSSLLKFFISMVTSAPRNVMIVDQIWHFVILHDAALANLISPAVIHQEEYKTSAYFFTALMGKIARKLPADAYKKKTLTYLRLLNILKLQAFENVSSENRMVLVHNALLFLFNFAFNTEAAKEEQTKTTSVPCRTVLTQHIDFTATSGNLDDEISVGVILKLVRDSLNRMRLPNTIPTAKTLECHSAIVETGLTLAYFHSEVFIRRTIGQGAAGRSTSKFQQELCTVIEDYFAVDLAIHKDAVRGNYTEMMLHRLRRLAHTP